VTLSCSVFERKCFATTFLQQGIWISALRGVTTNPILITNNDFVNSHRYFINLELPSRHVVKGLHWVRSATPQPGRWVGSAL
jgi:hypothetical protein